MAEVIWTQRAADDLMEIHRFIARDYERYASRTVQRIRAAAALLSEFPLRGRTLPEGPNAPLREIIVGPYRVIYRYLEGEDAVAVAVLAVIHGRRLLPAEVANE